jgi:hypothetical protein
MEFNIKIHDNDEWNPDLCFMVELYDSLKENKPRLEGEDTKCKVTIIDEDKPGKISFKDINLKVVRPDSQNSSKV